MEKKPLLKRILAVSLAAAVTVNGLTFSALAEDNGAIAFEEVSSNSVSAGLLKEKLETDSGESLYEDSDVVRVSIVLKDKPTIENTVEMGYDVENIAENAAAMNYRSVLQDKQENLVNKIEKVTDENLDVVWNMTLAANIISANVEYGQIEDIEALEEVEEVLIETQYYPDVLKEPLSLDPNMATSSEQIGSQLAWAEGYTGAGSRIAVIDTGTDNDHQSFSEAGYLHSLEELAKKEGVDYETYVKSLNLLTKEEILSVKDQLNAGTAYNSQNSVTPIDERVYLNAKLPFAYNYVDSDYDINHDNDTQGEHGSHVAGIAAANSWIAKDGGFVKALEDTSVLTQGVAPDAQLITMKVFGKGGGAYDSDYMVAIEDAIVLKADAVNLSLGSGNPGTSKSATKKYQEIFENLSKSGIVVSISAGNSGYWAENVVNENGYLYADDVSMQTDGSPGSFTNAFTVASVDNAGATGAYIQVGDKKIVYNETPNYNAATGKGFKSITSLAGAPVEYVFTDGFGSKEEWAALGDALKGRIAVCSRGNGINFTDKANWAIEAGAIGTIVYNNTTGVFGMVSDGYKYSAPYVSITQEAAAVLREYAVSAGTPVATASASAASEEETEAEETTAATEAAAESADVTEAVPQDGAEEAQSAATDQIEEPATETTEVSGETEAAEETKAPEAAETTAEEAVLAADAKPAGYIASMTIGTENGIVGPGEALTNNQTMSDFSSWGVPGSLQLKPEITAPGGNIYSVNGAIAGGTSYENMSGTSMAAPQIAGMSALAAQYVREKDLAKQTGLAPRKLIQSLLMSTAMPLVDDDGYYYPVIQQGAGLANINDVIGADSYILMDDNASSGAKDGKIKVELGDDPDMKGEYTFGFTVYNLTDSSKSYTLSTDLFTQYIFTSGGVSYMHTSTDDLTGMYTEEYTVNGAKTGAITVPANGSVKVDAVIKVDATALKAAGYLDGTKGIYIEGYTFAKGAADADGAAGTVHSIPILGFLGNWTDPSMFDVGSYIEYLTGEETRAPYLSEKTKTNENVFGIEYASQPGDVYYLDGSNPVISDAVYDPARAAINGNDIISLVQFSPIRNAANSLFAVINETNPEKSFATEAGPVNAAYYHTNQGAWMGTSSSLNIGASLGSLGFKEGDKAIVQFALAPEYYVDDSGETAVTAWDKVGEGASFGLSLTVDNTKPEIIRISIENDGTVLRVAARDNQYIAGVVLYNRTGDVIVSAVGSNADAEPDKLGAYMVPLDGVKGTEFIVQVYDYANNVSTYKFNEEIGGDLPSPDMLALSYNSARNSTSWNTISPVLLDLAEISGYAGCPDNFVAATIVDHYIFAVDENGGFYVMPEDDVYSYTKICSLGGVNVNDLAYNPVDKQIYGVSDMNTLITIDKLTGEVEAIARIPDTVTLACDKNGVFYANRYGSGLLYAFTMDDPGNPAGFVDYTEDFGETFGPQSMEIDPNTNNLCWTSMFREYSEQYSQIISAQIGQKVDVYIYTPLYFEVAVDIDFEQMTVDYNEVNISYLAESYLGLDTDPLGIEGQYYGLVITDKTTDALMYDFNGDGKTNEADGQALLDYRTGKLDEISNEENKDVDGDGDFDTHDAYVLLNTILWSKSTNEIHSVDISKGSVNLLNGGTYQLTATVTPWTATDRNVYWKTSDASVATVDSNGLVTAHKAGKCVITATSAADRSVYAECEVIIENLEVTLSGALQDTEGEPTFYKWNFETDDAWVPTVSINRLGAEINASTVDAAGNVYIADSEGGIHKIDPATGEDIETGAGINYADMAYSTVFSTADAPKVIGAVDSFVLLPEDPMAPEGRGYNFRNYGASGKIIAVASLGYAAVELEGTVYEGESVMAVESNGTIWDILLVNGGGMLYGSVPGVLPAGFLGSNDAGEYCSLVCGDDGNLYFAAFDGNTSNFYRITADAEGNLTATGFGNVGDGVWPVTINSVTSNSPAARACADADNSAVHYNKAPLQAEVYGEDAQSETESFDMTVQGASIPKLSSETGKDLEIMADSGAEVFEAYNGAVTMADEGGEEVPVTDDTASGAVISGRTMDVELKSQENHQPTESTNGLFVVKYSPEAIEFKGLEAADGVYNSYYNGEEGVLIVAFASALYTIPEDQPDQIANFTVINEELAKSEPIEVIQFEADRDNYINRAAPVVVKISSLSGSEIDEIVAAIEEEEKISLKEELNVVEKPVEPGPDDPEPGPGPDDPEPVLPSVPSGSGNFVDPAVTTAAADETTAAPDETTASADNNGSSSGDNSGDNSGNSNAGNSDTGSGDNSGSADNGSTGTNGGDVSVDTTAPVDNGTSGGNSGNGTGTDSTGSTGTDGSGSDSNVGNTGNGAAGDDKNQNTGVALFVAPAAVSALAVLVSRKKFKK